MTAHEETGHDRTTLFQGTVSAEREVVAALDHLDLDQLPGTERVDGTRTSFEALLRLDQVEALVDAGATVTVRRTVDTSPVSALATPDALGAPVDPLERLRPLERFREDRE